VKIEDQFHVDVPVDEAWKVLLDVERIAPCMPGAQLQEIEGDEYRGIVKVKVGPITAQYKGAARIVETDDTAHTLVLKAEGRDTRGQGNASATVTASLTPDDTGTLVHIDTDLNITGKVAQFGRGVMADVSSKLLGQFAENLHRDVLSGNGSEAPAATTERTEPSTPASAAEGVRQVSAPEPEPVDLLEHAGDAMRKRIVPIVITVVAFLTVRSLLRRRKRKRQERSEGSPAGGAVNRERSDP
jgi:carbon monoxide dehydrogenase subunit G